LVFSALWSVVVYGWVAWRRRQPALDAKPLLILPTLVIGPVVLVLAFQAFRVNLLFPVHLLSGFLALLQAALIPALVIGMASGVFVFITRSVYREYGFWRQKNFAVVAETLGLNLHASLRRLVLLKALADTWQQCLPWFFGELVIVEAVFNAPGLGMEAWRTARERDFSGLLACVLWLIILYGLSVLASTALSRWLGRKLESYG